MNKQADLKKSQTPQWNAGITQIAVSGYKSISQGQSIEIRPLTILAGANSSGKSSIMQPLLLLKQTLEESYEPAGALLLDGPHGKFTSADQLLSHISKVKRTNTFHVGISVTPHITLTTYFSKEANKGFDIQQMTFESGTGKRILRPGMTHKEIMPMILSGTRDAASDKEMINKARLELFVARNRCFLELGIRLKGEMEIPLFDRVMPIVEFLVSSISPKAHIEPPVRKLIHLPGLRGNPERTYPKTAVGPTFRGTFEKYVASVIAQWQIDDDDRVENLSRDLERLGLTWKVRANPISDVAIELQVGRTVTRGGAQDLVSIVDVGFGVSQTLPVLVALHTAKPGQLVYIEQPEIHLHPRAQSEMAQVLADAAKRGVRVVVETHSDLLLLGVQTLVAEGKLAPGMVKLHWFNRNKNGATEIVSTELDEAGAFGDWPEDFADTTLRAESRYLDAAEARHSKH